MENASLHLVCAILFCLYVGAKSASVAIRHTADGFWLDSLMPHKTFSYGVVPQIRGQDMSMSFYDVTLPVDDCSGVQVDIYDDGYVKADYNRIAILCDQVSLQKFTAVSEKGFYVVVKMGPKSSSGTLKGRFHVDGGIRVTNEVLY